jgi:hypothetical protein
MHAMHSVKDLGTAKKLLDREPLLATHPVEDRPRSWCHDAASLFDGASDAQVSVWMAFV